MNFLSLRPSTPPSQLYLRVFGPSTSVPDLAWQVRRQFTTRIIAPLPDPVGVSRPASKVMESRRIFLPFSEKKGRESFLRLAVEKKKGRWFGSLFGVADSFIRRECCFEPSAFRWVHWNAARSSSIRIFFGLDPRVAQDFSSLESLRPTAG